MNKQKLSAIICDNDMVLDVTMVTHHFPFWENYYIVVDERYAIDCT